ncbi:tetratricopeptide repeat protein [Salibacteraceae bacterium]|nr:tetratricopeptide repeat protein [Salibacteraceae bacterium]
MRSIFILSFVLFLNVESFGQLKAEKYIAMAREDINNQNYTLAIQKLNFAIKSKPYLIDAYFLRASSKYRLGDYKGATDDYTQCILINPLSAASFQNRGIARAQFNDHFGAIEDYKLAIKIDPLNYFIFVQKASSEVQIEEYDNALTSVDKAISINPYLGSGYVLRGIVLNQLEEYEKAIVDFNKAIELDPTDAEPWLRKAVSQNSLLNPTGALSDCDSAIARDSTSSLGYFIKGNIYADQLDYKDAEENYSKVIELNPNNALAFYNRGNIRIKLDNYNGAAYDYKKVIDINPDNILAHFNLALTFHKMDLYKNAEMEYSTVITLYPEMEDAWFNRAFVRRKLGNEAGAQIDFIKGNSIRGQNREKEYNLEEEEILKRFTQMDANFYHPNFDENEQRIVILAMPFFEIKSIAYREIEKAHLYYNTPLVNDYNEIHKNQPFFYITNYLLNENVPTAEEQFAVYNKKSLDIGNSKDDRFYLWQAMIYKSEFDFNNAIATYDTLLTKNPNSALAYFNKANAMLDLLELLLKLETGNGEFINAGDEYKSIELKDVETVNLRLKEIENLYEKAIELESDFYLAWFNKAIVLGEQRDFQGSLEAYSKAIKINEDFKEAYLNRGLNYLFLDNPKKACSDLSKAGELGLSEAYKIIKKYCK